MAETIGATADDAGLVLNDVQSALNATRVRRIVKAATVDDVAAAVRGAAAEGAVVSIAGSRHSMGGQQFATDGVHLDMQGMARLLSLDEERGIVDVEAGIEWARLLPDLVARQAGRPRQWGIRQKQTGSDNLSVGGALASNVHGRGLRQAPIVADVEAFTLVDANGRRHRGRSGDQAGPVPARDRRLRAVRRRDVGSASPVAPNDRPARRRADPRRRVDRRLRRADRRRLHVRRLPVLDRRTIGRLPEPRDLLVLPPRRGRPRRSRTARRRCRCWSGASCCT